MTTRCVLVGTGHVGVTKGSASMSIWMDHGDFSGLTVGSGRSRSTDGRTKDQDVFRLKPRELIARYLAASAPRWVVLGEFWLGRGCL